MRTDFAIRLLLLIASALSLLCAQAQSIEDFLLADHLPRFRPYTKVGSFSSYDRTGGNDDGFSGKYSYLRKEGDSLVIAELKGPGIITRIWTPTPTDDPIEFFFDDESQPRLTMPFRELFMGKRPPFSAPLVGYGAGGYYSYLPLPFQKSCKIRIKAAKVQFYQVNYALYAPDTKVATFQPKSATLQAAVQQVRQKFEALGQQRESSTVKTERKEHALRPGETVTLFDTKQPGRITGIRLSPASVFAVGDRRLLLRASWDDERTPAILCPVSDLFGYSFGQPAAESLPVGTRENTNYLYFPMPFDRSAKIEIISERESGEPVRFESEILWTTEPRRKDEGRFYAHWRRENPTTPGQPFTFVETQGRGHLVGAMLQAQGLESGKTLFFEGDDEATIDGEVAIRGTGSEDFFNGGWYDVPGRWYGRVSLPFSGALTYEKATARTGAYRLFLGDAYVFHKSLKLTIEHGPEKNQVPTDYTSVSFLYLQDPPTYSPDLLPASRRAVISPKRSVFVPGWNEPVHAFSMENASIRKRTEKIGKESVRYLSFEGHGKEVFGPHFIAFTVNIPKTAQYQISLQAFTGPKQSTAQMLLNDSPIGSIARFQSAERKVSSEIPLATLPLKAGENHLFFRIGSEASNPEQAFQFDFVRVICTEQ